jgi:hypothetical protein
VAELDDLRALARHHGPFLSVHLPCGRPAPDTAERLALTWRGHRREAAEAGAPEGVLRIVDQVVDGSPQRHGMGVSVVATPHARPVVDHLPVPPAVEAVTWERVPSLLPLIEARQTVRPHVVALVDRAGADLLVRRSGEGDGDGDTREVEGDDYPLRKVAGGGWSHRRFQQRAEDTWHRNMSEVADELSTQAHRVGAVLVAVGGDQRAVTILHEAVPEDVRDLLTPIDVTRAADGTADDLDGEVERVLRDRLAADLSNAVESYRQELGQRDRATAGPADTFAALRSARVTTLLTTVDGDHRAAWVARDHRQVALSPEDLPAGGERWPVRLVDAAVAGALASGADVRVVPADVAPPDGIGALLRW